MNEYVLEVKGITKQFGQIMANKNVDFTLKAGETHAVVGENGAGKTTLMKIIYGQYRPDKGYIYVDGQEQKEYSISKALKLGIGMVHQNFMLIENMTVIENVILNNYENEKRVINYKRAEEKVKDMLRRFGLKFSPKRLVDKLYVGEKQKVEIIKALYAGARILILDEPTAILTPQEAKELFSIINILKKEGKSIIFISHKLREVAEVADRVTVMRHGEVVGRFSRNELDESEIARLMVGKEEAPQLVKNNNRGKCGKTRCELENIFVFDENGIPKVKGVSLDVKEGEILGIGGVEGNGQRELINSIIGVEIISFGKIKLDGIEITKMNIHERRDAGIGYISEDRMTGGLNIEASIADNIICGEEGSLAFSKHRILNYKAIREYSKLIIENFDIRGTEIKKPVKNLSGGNMQKVVLAREISRNPKLLIAAHPTRGLDIAAVNFVRKKLLEEKDKGTAIILVSADLEELMSMSDRMLIMYEGKINGEIFSEELSSGTITEEKIGLMMGGVT